MPEQVQRQHHARGEVTESPQDEAASLKNEELDADVACCLAEIDCCLAEVDELLKEEEETERERAIREFRELAGSNDVKALRVWQATYAHLNLHWSRNCCGNAQLYDKEGQRWLT